MFLCVLHEQECVHSGCVHSGYVHSQCVYSECVGGGYHSRVRVWEVLELGAIWGSSLLMISAEAKRDTERRPSS